MGEGVVTRIVHGTTVPPDDIAVTLNLILRLTGEFTEEQF